MVVLMTTTKRARRTDAHRPGAIVPADYVYVLSYALATTVDGWPVPPVNVDAVIDITRDAGAAGHRVFGSLGRCGVCGACYKYGDLWRHEPSGEIVHLGHDCADKYELVADRQCFERELDGARVRSAREHVREMRAEQVTSFLAAHEGLAADLECDHDVTRDLMAKLALYGSLSPAQVALAHKLAADARRRAQWEADRATETLVAAPQGKRQTFTGEIVGAKVLESQYGATLKITVKVTTADGGSWLAWGTCPRAISDAVHEADEADAWRASGGSNQATTGDRLRGRRVTITATLKPGREPHFAVMDRPAGALESAPQWMIDRRDGARALRNPLFLAVFAVGRHMVHGY